MTEISIIVVSFNTRADLARCLGSLRAAPPSSPHEIVVVDNHSTDGSADEARRWPDVRLIENETTLGFARANNIGIRASRGANLLLLAALGAVVCFGVSGATVLHALGKRRI